MIQAYVMSIRQAITQENWYCALALALALPDICGSIEFPAEHSSRKRYVAWYDQYISQNFQKIVCEGTEGFILSGADCYALRCSFLHNGSENISTQKAREVMEKFYFVQPFKSWSFNTRARGTMLIVQVDRFCLLICNSVDVWVNGQTSSGQGLLKIYNPKIDGIPL